MEECHTHTHTHTPTCTHNTHAHTGTGTCTHTCTYTHKYSTGTYKTVSQICLGGDIPSQYFLTNLTETPLESMSVLEVRRGSSVQVEYPINEPGTAIRWGEEGTHRHSRHSGTHTPYTCAMHTHTHLTRAMHTHLTHAMHTHILHVLCTHTSYMCYACCTHMHLYAHTHTHTHVCAYTFPVRC